MRGRYSARALSHALALAAVTLALTPGQPARAQTDERFAMALFGTLGLGGELQVESSYLGYLVYPDGPSGPARPEFLSSSLRPTLGGGLSLSFVPVRHVAVGALVSIRGTATSNHVARRINDFDVFVAARLPIAVQSDGRTLTPYLTMPAGFSTGAGGGLLGDRRAWLGFNVGVLAGAELEVQEGLAVYAELGWQRHELRYQRYGIDAAWVANQAVLNVGVRAAR